MATQAATVQITMPAMGESVTEGTVLDWLKQVGDAVTADEPLVEVSTDKVDAEVPAPASGTLVRILVGPDETVQVGAALGEIEVGEAPAAAARRRARAPPRPPATARPRTATARASSWTSPSPRWATRWPRARCSSGASRSGDAVAVDDILVEISTDKVDAELPSPVAGTLSEILVQADETVRGGHRPLPHRGRRGRRPGRARTGGPGRGAQGHVARRGRARPRRPAWPRRWPPGWPAPTAWTCRASAEAARAGA